MRTRLIPYAPFGARRGALPDALQAQVVSPLGDQLPTASVHYPVAGVNAGALDGVVELGFEFWNGSAWVEPPNCRYLAMKGSRDHLEEVPTQKYEFTGIGWLLRGAKVWEAAGLPVDADGKVQFNSATAGQIMATLITNAQRRGWGPGLSVDFTAGKDSDGKAWAKVLTIAYDVDVDLDTVLVNLYRQGVCDYRWEGRTLRIFNPDTAMGRDLAAGASPLRLLVADGQTAAPEDWTNEDQLTDAMVLGEDGKRWKFNNGSRSPLGRIERVITQGGVSDEGTAAMLAEPDLLAGTGTRFSYTREFAVNADTLRWPFRDFGPGDWALAQRGAAFERLRVQSLSLTVTAEDVTGHAVLGDRIEDLLTKLAKRTKGITGGASAGGSGVRPAPEGPDKRIPAAPSGLTVAPSAYIDQAGVAQGRVALGWAHSGKATNGTDMRLDRFQVFYRVNETGMAWRELVTVTGQDTALDFSPLPIYKAGGELREEYAFKVRAVGENAVASAFSAVVAVSMEDDTTAPPVPEFRPADLTTWLRTVTVNWSGKGIAAGQLVDMPGDAHGVRVYQGESATGPWVLVGTSRTSGLVHQTGTMPLAKVWYCLTSFDGSGNESDLSEVQSVTPAQLVNADEILKSIDAGKVALENAGLLAVADMTDPAWSDTDGGIQFSAAMGRTGGSSLLVPAGTKQRGTYLGLDPEDYSKRVKLAPGMSYRMRVSIRGMDIPRGGASIYLRLYTVGGGQVSKFATPTMVSNGEPVTMNEWGEIDGIFTVPEDSPHIYAAPGLYAEGITSGAVRFSDLIIQEAVTGPMIVPNSIITRHLTVTEDMTVALLAAHKVKAHEIDVNSLTADAGFVGALRTNILSANAVDAVVIKADAITAKHTITGARFQTDAAANTGIMIDTVGFRAWNTLNVETIRITRSNGDVTITGGTLQTTAAASRGVKFNALGLNAWDSSGNLMFSLDSSTGRGRFSGRMSTGPSTEAGITIVPPSEASGRSGIWFTKQAGIVGGEETAGAWIDAPTGTSVAHLHLRGKHGGGVEVENRLIVQGDSYLQVTRGGASGRGYVLQEANGSYFSGSVNFNGGIDITASATSLVGNAHIDGNGKVWRSSSAARFKIDARPSVLPESLLELDFKDWIDKGQVDQYAEISNLPRPLTEADTRTLDLTHLGRVGGVIAEDVELAAGAASELFVTYDSEGRIEGVAYDRLGVALALKVTEKVKELAAELAALRKVAQ